MAGMFPKTTTSLGREEVYVAAMPLRASKGPAQLLMSVAFSLHLWDFQHFMVIVKPNSTQPQFQTMVYDFQPKNPESIYVALDALSGKAISGVVFTRKMSKLPRKKCWFVGACKVNNSAELASDFNQNWDTNLRVGHHDCRDYTNGLVECLTGEKHVLHRLRRSNSS